MKLYLAFVDIAVTIEIQKTINKFSISIPKELDNVSPIIKKIGMQKKEYRKKKLSIRLVLPFLSYCLLTNFDKYSNTGGQKIIAAKEE